MSLNLTLQTTLDFDTEFQSMLNTMVLLSNFARNVKNQKLMKEDRLRSAYLQGRAEYYNETTKQVEEAIGFLPTLSEKDTGEKLLYMWGANSFLNTNANILDKRFENTKLFLKVAPIKVAIENKYDVVFSKGDKHYTLNIENLPTINRLLRSSQAVREEFPPVLKKTTTLEDVANYDVHLPAYTQYNLQSLSQ